MLVADWMSTNLLTVPPTLSADGAAALLEHYGIRHLPVVEPGGCVVGLISDRDLVPGVVGNRSRYATRRHDPHRVADLMSTPVLTAQPTDELRGAVHRMLCHHVSALPVIDGENRLVGMLTNTDGLCALLQVIAADAPTVNEQLSA